MLYADNMQMVGGTTEEVAHVEAKRGSGDIVKHFIDTGLRAQLSLPNFVTNQVNVTIDLFPNLPATIGHRNHLFRNIRTPI